MATELALCGLGLLLLVLDMFVPSHRKHLLGYVALAGFLLCLVPATGVCAPDNASGSLFGGLYLSDDFHRFFRLLACLLGALVTLLSFDYLDHLRHDRGVYFCVLVFGVLAVVLLAGAGDLIMLYLGVEFLSISSYILVGFLMGNDKRHEREVMRSREASIKYLIYGAVASAVMLFGISLIYGLAGSLELPQVAVAFSLPGYEGMKLVAVALVTVGLGFKIGVAPFHHWAPDVYEGAPTPVAAFLAVGSKGAAFAAAARFYLLAIGDYQGEWAVLLAAIAVLTMFIGNLMALIQGNIKRMLGYSSVAHAGYMLVALVVNGEENLGVQALLIYLAAYLFMTVGAFALVIWYERSSGSERIEDYAGLAYRAPIMAVSMLIFMLALTGIPPTAGFIGKLYLLRSAVVSGDWWWLGLMIVINSVISAAYYINVVRVMFFLQPTSQWQFRPAFSSPVVVGLCATATVLLSLQFGVLLDLSHPPLASFLLH